jgi:hypothetical protein
MLLIVLHYEITRLGTLYLSLCWQFNILAKSLSSVRKQTNKWTRKTFCTNLFCMKIFCYNHVFVNDCKICTEYIRVCIPEQHT